MKFKTIGPTEVSASVNVIAKKEYHIKTLAFGNLCLNNCKVSMSSPMAFAVEFYSFNTNNNSINCTAIH